MEHFVPVSQAGQGNSQGGEAGLCHHLPNYGLCWSIVTLTACKGYKS